MTCDEARARFSDVADARLAPAEQAAWDAHLATCADCRREWAGFQRTVGLLHGLPRHRAPAGFVERVMAARHPLPWPQRLARRLFVPVRMKLPLEAVALVLVAVGAVYLVQRTPEMQQAMRDTTPTASYPPPAPAKPELAAPSPPPAPQPRPAPARPEPIVQPAAPKQDLQGARSKTASERTAGTVQSRRDEAAPAPSAPAPEARAPGRGVAESMQKERVRTTAAVAPAVMGRLAVENRDAAERALAVLIARLGATEVGRTAAEDRLLVELDVPRAQYAEFMRGLAGIGGWTPREERVGSGAEVRVRLIVVRSPAP